MLGLGSNISKLPTSGATIVTDNLVLRHDYTLKPVQPLSDGAALFDAATEFIACGNDTSLDLTSDMTIMAWVNPTTAGQNAHIAGRDNGSLRNYTLYVNGNRFYYGYFVGGSEKKVGSSTADTANTWVHLTATRDRTGDASVMYVNGVNEDADDDGTDAIDNDDYQFTIGARYASAASFAGLICNVGLWSRALTQAEIKSIMWKNYSQLNANEVGNLVSWWNLDVETATDGTAGSGGVKDYNSTNHGTLT